MRKSEWSDENVGGGNRRRWLSGVGLLLVVMLAFLGLRYRWSSPTGKLPVSSAAANARTISQGSGIEKVEVLPRFPRRSAPRGVSAAEIVNSKLTQFGQSRRRLAEILARRHGVVVTDEVKRFFDAVETGRWEEIESAFKQINGGDTTASHSDNRPSGVAELWPAIIDAYGVAEQVHLWPPDKLLEYGNGILEVLKPGMIYVGGTDSGRWIPELLNETHDGERHIIITQNGLAGSDYLEYVRLQYGDQIQIPTDDATKAMFTDYVADAQRRYVQDQEHPEEPKQVRPGEEIQMVDGKASVSGSTAVMSINEKILESLLKLNSDRSFALQESFPLKGTYAEAVPLGPLMELRVSDPDRPFDARRAAESIDYWRDVAQRIEADPASPESTETGKSYSHDTAAAANLLVAREFYREAEEGYRLAIRLWPGNPEATGGLAALMERKGQSAEARRLLEEFVLAHADERGSLERVSETFRKEQIGAKPSP